MCKFSVMCQVFLGFRIPLPFFWHTLNLYTRAGYWREGLMILNLLLNSVMSPTERSDIPTSYFASSLCYILAIVFEELPSRQFSLKVIRFKITRKGVNNAIDICFAYSYISRVLEQCHATELMLSKYFWTHSWHHIIMSWAPHSHNRISDKCPQSFSSLLPPHPLQNHYSLTTYLFLFFLPDSFHKLLYKTSYSHN